MSTIKIDGLDSILRDIKEDENFLLDQLLKIEGQEAVLELPTLDIAFKFSSKNVEEFIARLPSIIEEAHRSAVKGLIPFLKEALDSAMESSVWDWDGDTRDIVDTGELKNSLNIFIDNNNNLHIVYDKDYAAIVHYGGYFNAFGNKNASQYYPGRPWVKSVIEGGGPVPQFDFANYYRDLFIKQINSIIR